MLILNATRDSYCNLLLITVMSMNQKMSSVSMSGFIQPMLNLYTRSLQWNHLARFVANRHSPSLAVCRVPEHYRPSEISNHQSPARPHLLKALAKLLQSFRLLFLQNMHFLKSPVDIRFKTTRRSWDESSFKWGCSSTFSSSRNQYFLHKQGHANWSGIA